MTTKKNTLLNFNYPILLGNLAVAYVIGYAYIFIGIKIPRLVQV